MISFARPFLERLTFAALGSDPMLGLRLHKIAASGVLTVLNLHRVDDKKGSAYDEAMHPAIFDELVGWLNTHFRIGVFGLYVESIDE